MRGVRPSRLAPLFYWYDVSLDFASGAS